MSLTNAQYDQIMQVYNQKQLRNHRILEQRQEEVYARIPRMAEIDAEVADVSVRKAFYLLGDHTDGKNIDIPAILADLSKERQTLLVSNGFPEDYLEPVYDCPICHDTGYVKGKKCTCFKQMEMRLLYSDSNLDQAAQTADFRDFSLSYYSTEKKDPATGQSEREEAAFALQTAKTFSANFGYNPETKECINLLLYGDVGVGKTFLSHCIAGAFLRGGKSVLYLTAYDLFDKLGKYRFASEDSLKDLHDSVFSANLLIIDDLGAEMVNNFVSSELFLIVNERLLNHLPTVISTNLSMENFRDSFSERTFSRMMGSYTLIHLSGRDIRIQKKLSGGN